VDDAAVGVRTRGGANQERDDDPQAGPGASTNARTGRELLVGAAIARGYREMGVRLNGAATDRFQEANSRKLLRKLFRALEIRST
jgi:hypothetical protein